MSLPKFALFAGTATATVYYWERIAAFATSLISSGAGRAAAQIGGAALLAVGAGTAVQSSDIDVTREMAVSFVDQLRKERWREGTSNPSIWKVAGKEYWIVTEGSIDSDTLANGRGYPITRRCLKLYATLAEPTDGGYRMPKPYLIKGNLLVWPHLATDCRFPTEGGWWSSTVEFQVRGSWKKTRCPVTEDTIPDGGPQYCIAYSGKF